MKPREYFPLGKAYGEAFCNRVEETKKLVGNIENGKHTFLVAPRRYGKSSLCEKALEAANLPWSKLDFHLAISRKDIERIIVNGVVSLIGKSIGSVEKLVTQIKSYAKKLKPKLGIGNKNFHLELELTEDSNPAETIAEALLMLEKLLQSQKKRATLLLDEFQEIDEIDGGKSIEGAIRHAAQETKNLAIIFSGSNPHLLKNMFEEERRPLYKLCRKLVLDRISKNDYRAHINKAAKAMWNKKLPEEVFDEIMNVSEQHPYYVNYLCDVLWSENETIPAIEDVNNAWNMIIEEERSDLLKDFFMLSTNQRKVVIFIANHGGTSLFSHHAAKTMDMPASSVNRVLITLIEKDFIAKTKDEYILIVPIYKALLQKQNA